MKTTRQSGITVLCLLLFAAIVVIVSSVIIFQLVRLCKRLDNGRVPRATNEVDDIYLPSTNGVRSFAVALEFHYEWLTFPDGDLKAEPLARPRPIQLRIWIEAGQLRLEPLREEWQAVPAASIIELDADGIPIDWQPRNALEGTPITIEWSTNLVQWTNVGTIYVVTNALFQGNDFGFYRARK